MSTANRRPVIATWTEWTPDGPVDRRVRGVIRGRWFCGDDGTRMLTGRQHLLRITGVNHE